MKHVDNNFDAWPTATTYNSNERYAHAHAWSRSVLTTRPTLTSDAADIDFMRLCVCSKWEYTPHRVDWVSGFFPGLMYLIGNQTQDDMFTKFAHAWTKGLASEALDNSTHDGSVNWLVSCPTWASTLAPRRWGLVVPLEA